MDIFKWASEKYKAVIVNPIPKSVLNRGFESGPAYEIAFDGTPGVESIQLIDSFDNCLELPIGWFKNATANSTKDTITIDTYDGSLTLMFFDLCLATVPCNKAT